MRDHWGNCITHFDAGAYAFIDEYFATETRRTLLIGGAGFDPRTKIIATALNRACADRLTALFVREERAEAAPELQSKANAHEAALLKLVPSSKVIPISIFDPQDNAPVGGSKMIDVLSLEIPKAKGITDIILDMSALSMGIAFPAAKFLLAFAESTSDVNLHLLVASQPELDALIVGEPAERVQAVRGFTGNASTDSEYPKAKIWLPHLAPKRRTALEKIQATLNDVYKVCPVLPFPATDPRRADILIEEFGDQLRDEWNVDARDLMYVSERNPLDCFRSIETLKKRYDKTVAGIFDPQLILSPVGSKVMATGAMMAAIKYDLNVQYVEALRFEMEGDADSAECFNLVHLWLHGPIYAGFV